MNLEEVSKLINANSINNKGKGVKIAVFDTGFSPHPAIRNVVGGLNFTPDNNNNKNDFTDGHSHGTHTAGIISYFVSESEIYICKVLTNKMIGLSLRLYDAIDYCIERGIRIINMSLSTPVDLCMTKEYIKKAVKNNILIVAAAGNTCNNYSSSDEVSYPAFYNEVVSVGACDNQCKPAGFSSTNIKINIVAPGSGIISCGINGGYVSKSGTSQAAPIVTAMAARILCEEPYMNEPGLFKKLMRCTKDIGYDRRQQGSGMIDMSKYSPYALDCKVI